MKAKVLALACYWIFLPLSAHGADAQRIISKSASPVAPKQCISPQGQWPKADPAMLPRTCPKQLTQAEITNRLNDLFSNWNGSAAAYAFFFLSMPNRLNIENDAASALAPPVLHDTEVHLNYYTLTDANATIKAVKLSALDGYFPTGSNDQIFVKVNSLGVTVPVKVAGMLSQQFTAGFVTRLVLEADKQSFINRNISLTFPSLDISGPIDPGGGLRGFETLSAYQTCVNAAGSPCTTLEDVITNQFIGSSPEMIGIVLGWRAASELLAVDTTASHRYLADAWQLVHCRYSTRTIGKLVGFTLNYVTGYALNTRIASGATSPSVQSNDALIKAVSNDQQVQSAKQFMRSFYNIWLAEAYAISQAEKKKSKNWQLLDDYFNMLAGFQEGVNNAFGLIYEEEGDIEWSAGYSRGYKDGYSAGYAAGYYDGYAAGNAQAWKQANAIITGLQSQIQSLQGQLNAAQSGNGGNSCNGFWGTITCAANTISGIIKPISTIVGIVTSLF
jgi:hypothetical protein